jgi:predicted TIM-barrel enzyme
MNIRHAPNVSIVGPHPSHADLVGLPITLYVTEEVLHARTTISDEDLAHLLNDSFQTALSVHRDKLLNEGPTPTDH